MNFGWREISETNNTLNFQDLAYKFSRKNENKGTCKVI